MTVTALRVEASREIGCGHLQRALTMAEALAEEGHRPVFVTREGSLAKIRLDRLGAGQVITFAEEAAEADAILSAGPGLVIFDAGSTTHARLEPLKAVGCYLVTFDDLGDGRYLADLVVDANLTAANNPRKLETPTRFLLGHEHVILSRACRAARRKRRRFGRFEKVIVSCGGSDPQGVTVAVIKALEPFDTDVDVEIVVGPAFSQAEELEAALLKASRPFTMVENPPDFHVRLRQADVGVLNGGLTFFEAAHLGLPAVVIAQNQAQLTNVSGFAAEGLTTSLGVADKVACDRLPDELKKLSDPEKRRVLAAALQKKIDGKGLDRVLAAVRELLGK